MNLVMRQFFPGTIMVYDHYPDDSIIFYFTINKISDNTSDKCITFFRLELLNSLETINSSFKTVNSNLLKLLISSFRSTKILCELSG